MTFFFVLHTALSTPPPTRVSAWDLGLYHSQKRQQKKKKTGSSVSPFLYIFFENEWTFFPPPPPMTAVQKKTQYKPNGGRYLKRDYLLSPSPNSQNFFLSPHEGGNRNNAFLNTFAVLGTNRAAEPLLTKQVEVWCVSTTTFSHGVFIAR